MSISDEIAEKARLKFFEGASHATLPTHKGASAVKGNGAFESVTSAGTVSVLVVFSTMAFPTS